MSFDNPEDFYNNYAAFKRYETPILKSKHIRWYDTEFWFPAKCTIESSVLELGSGTGEFLAYLKFKGVKRFKGVEQDTNAIAVMEDGLINHVYAGNIWDFFDDESSDKPFCCIVMLDVLEHFSAGDGVRLFKKLRTYLDLVVE